MTYKKKKGSNKLVNVNRVDGSMDGREYGQINEQIRDFIQILFGAY